MSPLFETDDGSIHLFSDAENICHGSALTENGDGDCFVFDNTPWKVSVQDGTPIHVSVGGFESDHIDSDFCPTYPGGCDPDIGLFGALLAFNDDRIGTYEFDLKPPDYKWILPDGSDGTGKSFRTAEPVCHPDEFLGIPIRTCDELEYEVGFRVEELAAATAPVSAPLAIGLPNFTGPAGTYISSATPMIPQTGDPNAEGFQYRFHAQGGPLPIYPFLPPQPYPVHWAHVDLAPGVHSAEVTIDGANSGDGPYDFQYSAESFGNLLEPRHTTTVILDTTPPAISITIPIKTTYLLNQAINANYACTDGGSGVATCTGTVANGSSIDTSSVGGKTFTVNATDRVGNVSPPQSVTYTVTANFVPTTLAGNLTAKSGPQNARVWTLSLLNNGPGGAFGTAINSFTLKQTFGAACTPVIGTAFPLAESDLAPAQTGTANVTIDFTGCAAAARFTAQFTYSANAGAVSGNVVRFNQFE
jgi:hypothetical protein